VTSGYYHIELHTVVVATASRRTPPVLHCHSPGVATVARRLRIDVNNNIDNNDNDDNDNA